MLLHAKPAHVTLPPETPWLDLYIPAPSPLPEEYYTIVIIGAG